MLAEAVEDALDVGALAAEGAAGSRSGPRARSGGPVRPCRASSAAATPAWAAQPQCTRLTVPPVRLASMMPAPMLAAMPIAEVDAARRPARAASPRPRPRRRRRRSRWRASRARRRPSCPAPRRTRPCPSRQVDLDAHGRGGEVRGAGRADGLGGGERRGQDGRRRVQHRRQVGVVEVEAVRQRAVDQRGRRRGQRRPSADRRSPPASRPTPATTAAVTARRLGVARRRGSCRAGRRCGRRGRRARRVGRRRRGGARRRSAASSLGGGERRCSCVAHHRDRTHRRPGAADDAQRGEHEEELGEPLRRGAPRARGAR